ncbi:amino acid transporter AVT1C [Aphidius gifuensis]|uniref:amino acid transporter AVT1C n=1 Tax=Aphidius gifuensis TaxID=684658 RepID=UPI001CDC13DF|nr:amino acid transporter AVT1C [Aphidius gifuensis]
MMNSERDSLINRHESSHSGLSVLFATLCIIDIFGVFPIIALPRAIVQCGLLGIPLVIVVVLLQIYTAILLGKSWTIASSLDPQIFTKNRYPLAAVTEFTLGPKFRTCVTVLLDLTVFGCGIPNLLVASQNLQLFGLKVSDNQFDMSFCYWLLVVGIGLCPLMWLGSPRDMKSLAITSTIAVIATAVLVWWCIISDDRQLNSLPLPTSPTWDKFISGYGMLAFQFDVHPTLMTIQVDMKRPKNINKSVVASFLFTAFIFGTTTSLAIWKYGASTTANILQIAPPSYASRAAILISALQLIFSSVIGHSALFLHLEDELHVQRNFGWKRCAMRSAIVLLGVIVGESVPRFDIVMALIGGTLTGPLVFVLPPIMYAKAKALKEKAKKIKIHHDIQSATECHSSEDNVIDEKAHSQSIHYRFNDKNPDNHKCVYYANNNNNNKDHEQDDLAGPSNFRKKLKIDNIGLVETPPPPQDSNKLSTYKSVQSRPIAIAEKDTSNIDLIVDWFGYFVVFLGILITLSSTYINIKNTIRFVRFTPPCIVNASIAAHF